MMIPSLQTASFTAHSPRAASGAPQPPVFAPPAEVFTPSEQTIKARSGLSATVRQDQMGVAIKATLPAGGGLLPIPVVLEGTLGGSWAARTGQDARETQVGSDGRVYVQLEPGAPAVVFDPRNLDFGLSGGCTPTQAGWNRGQMELLDQNGVRKYIFNEEMEHVSPGVVRNEYTEVRWDGQQLTANRVIRTQGQAQVESGGQLMSGLKSYVHGPDNQDIHLDVQGNADNSLTVTPPKLGQLASKNAVRLLFGDVVTPYMQHQKNQGYAGTFMPLSALPPGTLFPALVGGLQAPPRAPVQAPPPLPPAPPPSQNQGLMEQLGFGGNDQEGGSLMDQLGLDGLFGQRPQPAPPGPPPQAPVSFGQPAPTQQAPVQFGPPAVSADPLQALRQRYPQASEAKLQAAWTLADGNPQKAEQLLLQLGIR
ncbi:MAG: hypothetical protein AMXMBFR33_00950 [Candidatus Xenobia bacterium]